MLFVRQQEREKGNQNRLLTGQDLLQSDRLSRWGCRIDEAAECNWRTTALHNSGTLSTWRFHGYRRIESVMQCRRNAREICLPTTFPGSGVSLWGTNRIDGDFLRGNSNITVSTVLAVNRTCSFHNSALLQCSSQNCTTAPSLINV